MYNFCFTKKHIWFFVVGSFEIASRRVVVFFLTKYILKKKLQFSCDFLLLEYQTFYLFIYLFVFLLRLCQDYLFATMFFSSSFFSGYIMITEFKTENPQKLKKHFISKTFFFQLIEVSHEFKIYAYFYIHKIRKLLESFA